MHHTENHVSREVAALVANVAVHAEEGRAEKYVLEHIAHYVKELCDFTFMTSEPGEAQALAYVKTLHAELAKLLAGQGIRYRMMVIGKPEWPDSWEITLSMGDTSHDFVLVSPRR